MNPTERAVVFDCEGDRLIGILSEPPQARSDLAVLIIVGGPQYRVGSHRQFVHLSRHLAAEGWPTFRFDYRGMGDAEGDMRPFDRVDADIRAAIDALMAARPSVRRVILWGLCDGASAAMMYAGSDPRVAGLAMANPWVRDAQTQAATQVKHYYGGRLLSGAFWKKLLSGGVDIGAAAREGTAALTRAFGPKRTPTEDATFQTRMLTGWQRNAGPALVLISGNDLTAKEFLERVAREPAWQAQLASPACRRFDLAEADHTFSTASWKSVAAARVSTWLAEL